MNFSIRFCRVSCVFCWVVFFFQAEDGIRDFHSFAYGVLICSLSVEQVLTVLGRPRSQAADPVAVLMAYVTFYDLRGGGIETSLKGDKQGLGRTFRKKKRFEARHMLVLLGSLAHNVVVWARGWLSSPETSTLWHLAHGA